MIARQEDGMRVTQEAALWFMELQTGGESCHADFAQWLRRSPEHVEEFLAISGVSRKLDGVDPERRIDVQALLESHDSDIIQLLSPAQRSVPPQLRERPRWLMAVAAVVLIACTVLLMRWLPLSSDSYVTRTGEQRTFRLDDGSLIYLNTQSRAEVRLSNKTREVRLLAGEALFEIARDAGRPFTVVSGGATVRVIGTQFNVNRSKAGLTTVSVLEGAVSVSMTRNAAAGESSVRVAAGEQANVRSNGIEKQTLPDAKSVTAWRERRLVFRDKSLADVAAEFNRYNTLRFEVLEGAGKEPLSGVFAADRPELFASFLMKDDAVTIERIGDRYVIRPR